MQRIKLSLTIITILFVLVFTSAMGTRFIPAPSATIEKHLLCQKWELTHYSVFGENFPPDPIEENDFITFKSNNTYSAISEGESDNGTYSIKKGRIYLNSNVESEELVLIVRKLSETVLCLSIDDSSDPDAKYLEIYFKKAEK